VEDPANRLTLQLTDSYRVWYAVLSACLIGGALAGAILAWRWGFRPLSILVVVGALCALALAQRAARLARNAELRLTPLGFVTRAGRGERAGSWIDIRGFVVWDYGSGWPRQRMVSFELEPAYLARLAHGFGAFWASNRQSMLRYGAMSAADQVALLEQWRLRWTEGARSGSWRQPPDRSSARTRSLGRMLRRLSGRA
jgi:hypothetical protein